MGVNLAPPGLIAPVADFAYHRLWESTLGGGLPGSPPVDR
jgi:hypothetical protein